MQFAVSKEEKYILGWEYREAFSAFHLPAYLVSFGFFFPFLIYFIYNLFYFIQGFSAYSSWAYIVGVAGIGLACLYVPIPVWYVSSRRHSKERHDAWKLSIRHVGIVMIKMPADRTRPAKVSWHSANAGKKIRRRKVNSEEQNTQLNALIIVIRNFSGLLLRFLLFLVNFFTNFFFVLSISQWVESWKKREDDGGTTSRRRRGGFKKIQFDVKLTLKSCEFLCHFVLPIRFGRVCVGFAVK